jgi:transcriptional regulator with XRE-family HTH domain
MVQKPISDPTIGQRIRDRRDDRGWSIRYAASRAGISPSTWSRIERGLMTADNRFILAEIAAALECPTTDLTRVSAPATDKSLITVQGNVYAIREALLEADLDEPPLVAAPPLAELEREIELIYALRFRCDYVGASRRLPDLIQGLHAAAAGPDRPAALRLMFQAGHMVMAACRYLGYPTEGWVGAEWVRRAADELGDPVMTGYAAFVRAHAATGVGAYNRGHSLAVHAVDKLAGHVAEKHAPEVLGLLLLTAGHTAYAVRRPADGVEYYAEAARLAARTGETDTFGQFFGPTNVAFWQIGTEADGGDPEEAVKVALHTNPAALPVPMRQWVFYLDTARALARVGRDRDAVRYLVTAERVAPQLVHASPLAAETARGLRDRAGGPALRALCERMGLIS